MTSAEKQYTNEMKKKFGYYATWNPGLPLELGDIGTFDGNVFTHRSNLSEKGIEFEIREDNSRSELEHNSNGSVAITNKLAGKIPPPGSVLADVDAGIIVEFSKENATVFKANNTTTPTIKDKDKVGDQVLELYNEGKWKKEWMVITELIVAESATVIISKKSNSKIELKANANIKLPALDIADAKFEFSSAFARGLETKIITAEGLTPLFKVMGVKKRIFRDSIFKSEDLTQKDEFYFEEFPEDGEE